jgi:NTP pyrophosphatase (non-canonical NTP hydrolase)
VADERSFEIIGRRIEDFARERGWDLQATAKDLAAAIAIEAAEMQELFLWTSPENEEALLRERRPEISDELADILIYAFRLAQRSGIDMSEAIVAKLARNVDRFPVDG